MMVLIRGFMRTRNPRMLLALGAVAIFFATDFYLFIAHLGWAPGSSQTELVEFIGDLGTAAMLAITFAVRFRGTW
jgi:hypothetical protein